MTLQADSGDYKKACDFKKKFFLSQAVCNVQKAFS